LYVFNPVPTAVPPNAISEIYVTFFYILNNAFYICAQYPPNYCPRVKGVASCVCVLPIFTISLN